MESNNFDIDQLIKTSGLKEPSSDFTSRVLQEIQEEKPAISESEKWINRFSWILPAIAVLGGIVFVFITFPIPKLSIFSWSELIDLTNIFNIFKFIFDILSGNIYALSGIIILTLYFLIDIAYHKIRSYNFIV